MITYILFGIFVSFEKLYYIIALKRLDVNRHTAHKNAKIPQINPRYFTKLFNFHQLQMRLRHITTHIAVIVGHGQNRSNRAAALDLQGE